MTSQREDKTHHPLCNCQDTCSVEAILSMDERGQVVIPKDVRENAGMKPGEKLAMISLSKEGEICCLVLVRTEHLSGMVKEALSPLAEFLKQE